MPKRRKSSAKQDRKGVLAVGRIVQDELDWIFREQPTDDFGIDAQIEVVQGEAVTGRLIAAQIKSGPSYFKSSTSVGWWYRPKKDDVEYWLDHSLPVIVVLYDPRSQVAYWQQVTSTTILPTKKSGKRILVPIAHRLDAHAIKQLSKLAEGKPYELRVRQLRLALPWMRLLESGRRILLEADEWVNKTSGRGDLTVVSVDEGNGDRQELGSWTLVAGLTPYSAVLPNLVPWADVALHQETYDDADHDQWEAECVYYDKEGDRIVSQSYNEWREQRIAFYDDGSGLRPYANGAGEVDFWRLELVLNELGHAFLRVDQFAEGDGLLLIPRAT